VNSHWITQRIDLFHITTRSSENWRCWLHSKFAIQANFIATAGAALKYEKGERVQNWLPQWARPSPFQYVSRGGTDHSRTFDVNHDIWVRCAIFTFWFSWKCSKYYWSEVTWKKILLKKKKSYFFHFAC
jgi:hypothetical protein